MSAILGPSGAGKTTLLHVLRGTGGVAGRQSGRLLVNGREMKLAALQSITGFVPQEVRCQHRGASFSSSSSGRRRLCGHHVLCGMP